MVRGRAADYAGGMPKDSKGHVGWLEKPEEHDYGAAADYLSLLVPQDRADATAAAFRTAEPVTRKAKDILRAAQLVLLDPANAHVASDLAKIAHGTALSPILVVRGDLPAGRPAVIADGYHRVCASYYTDENTEIPLLLVDLADRP